MNLLKDGYGLGALLHSSLAKQAKALYPKHAQQKAVGIALTGYNSIGVQTALSGFFMRNISMRLHLYGEAGEGHLRMCRFSNEPVCQPFSALPPLFDSNRQGF